RGNKNDTSNRPLRCVLAKYTRRLSQTAPAAPIYPPAGREAGRVVAPGTAAGRVDASSSDGASRTKAGTSQLGRSSVSVNPAAVTSSVSVFALDTSTVTTGESLNAR